MRSQFWAPAAPALLTVMVVGVLAAVLAALLTGLPAHLLPPTAAAAGCTGSGIEGTAFRDYNANGARDSREPGIGGIVVTATSAGGASTSCTTAADGTYGIDPPGGAAGGFPVRVEFTLPADGSLSFLTPGPVGPDSQTTVTFVAAPGSGVDVGFQSPTEYCGPSAGVSAVPDLVAACPAYGENNNNPDGLFKGAPVLYRFPYNAGSTNLGRESAVAAPTPTVAAVARQIGTTAGLAWNPGTQTLYAAAFLKRHAGFGPNGPGAIYQVTSTVPSTVPSLFYDFGAIAGVDPHPQPGQTCLSPEHNVVNTNANCWLHDSDTFDAVGKASFGDLALGPTPGGPPSGGVTTLYAVNLADSTLLSIPLANPAAYTATAIPVPANCPAVDFRPFGLGLNDGVLYVGAVCSAESTQIRSNLRAYVLAYPIGVAAFRSAPVLEFLLTYDRGKNERQWRYWLNRTTFNPTNPQQESGSWAQPWLTDITFDRGDMILALRDRNGDLFGIAGGSPDFSSPQNFTAVARGDLLRACANGAGGWNLEDNGKCGGGVSTDGRNNNQGPGGGEYYYQDHQAQPSIEETSWGSAVQLPGRADVTVTAFGPLEGNNATGDGGIKWYTNSTGDAARSYRVFDGTGEPIRFDSANGLSGLVALCPAEPLEIGNRIWYDSNGDGIQDAGEGGIGGLTVELYRDSGLVGTTKTGSDGSYLFNAANVTRNGAAGSVPGLCGAGGAPVYSVRVPNTAGANRQAQLAGLLLSAAQQDPTAGGSQRDSDGQPSGNNAVAPIACASLAAPGVDDHTIDFGFHPPVPPFARSQALATAEDTPLAIALAGRDPDGQPLTYSLVTAPVHGGLAGTPPQLTYTPDPDFNGPDGFTFKVNDGSFDSAPARVAIAVTPVNDPPVVASLDPQGNQIVSTEEDMPVSLVVVASDVDGDSLTYRVVTPPAHGTLSGALPTAVYGPALNYNGPDSFVFGVSDGFVEVTGTVQIAVAPVDDPPIAANQAVTATADTTLTITLAAVDVEGDPLAYSIVAQPAHGTLTGTGPQVYYRADGSYIGSDQFTFLASDGRANSNLAAVSISVSAAPVGLDVVPEPAVFDPRLFLPAITVDR